MFVSRSIIRCVKEIRDMVKSCDQRKNRIKSKIKINVKDKNSLKKYG